MNKVFSVFDIPTSRLHIDTTVALHQGDEGRVIHLAREQATKRLAAMISELPKALSVSTPMPGYCKVSADVIVLTSEEFADLMQRQFRAGVDHAQGFMPREFQL